MKKSLKVTLAALALVPCATLFVGCGQDQLAKQATVNTEGSYKSTSKSAFNSYTSNEDVSKTLNGYRFTMEAKANAKTKLSEQSVEKNILLNGIIKTDSTSLEAAFKMTMDGQDIIKSYIKEGYAYTEISLMGKNKKIKSAVDNDDIFGVIDKIEGTTITGPTTINDVQQILDYINTNEDLEVEASIDGNINKFHFSADFTDLSAILENSAAIMGSDFDCYFVFDSDILTGAQLSFKYTLNSEISDVDINAKISMEKYEGNINFPKLEEGYSELA